MKPHDRIMEEPELLHSTYLLHQNVYLVNYRILKAPQGQ